jgi:hypothetical protein
MIHNDQPAPLEWSAAHEALTALQGRALVVEVADHLAGRAWVTVWHGELETADDARLVEALGEKTESWQRMWPGCVVCKQGGNDYSAVQFGPAPAAPAVGELVDQYAEFAESIAPRHSALGGRTWWKITRAAPTAGPPR